MSHQKTILVPIYDGVISKNIVDSGALDPLLRAGHRVVLWVDREKVAYYTNRYGALGYEIVKDESRYRPWVINIVNFAIDCIPSRSLYLKHVRRMVQKRKYVLGAIRIFLWRLGHFRLFRRVMYALTRAHTIEAYLKRLFDQVRPDLVFCPVMVCFDEMDFLRLAQRRGIRTIGMVKSWDQISSKLLLPVPPDHLIVNSPIVRDEAIQMFGYLSSRISVVGLPQFDRYQEPKLQESREAFYARVSLDAAVPFVLYCAAGLWMAPDEPEILKHLDEEIERGIFGPLKVLVRMHPKYDCGAAQLAGTKHLVLDRPGTHVTKTLDRWEYEDHDLMHIISSLKHAAVTINTASTMTIEAAYFDRPIINIGFDPKSVPWALSVARYYEREHYAPILKTGGVRLAQSHTELVAEITAYLVAPARDHEGRERIVREQCVNREPEAAERLANVLLHQSLS